MKTIKFQNKMDDVTEKMFLWAFPKSFQPNWLSYFRIATVPVIAWLLLGNQIIAGFALFFVSGLTDLIDGAMARKWNKVTDLGKILDPVADKMLIGTLLIYIGLDYLIVQIFLVVIALEIIANLLSAILAYKIGRPVGANYYGKIKMVLQCLCIFIFFLGAILNQNELVEAATLILEIALFFALLAAIESMHQRWPKVKKATIDLIHQL